MDPHSPPPGVPWAISIQTARGGVGACGETDSAVRGQGPSGTYPGPQIPGIPRRLCCEEEGECPEPLRHGPRPKVHFLLLRLCTQQPRCQLALPSYSAVHQDPGPCASFIFLFLFPALLRILAGTEDSAAAELGH